MNTSSNISAASEFLTCAHNYTAWTVVYALMSPVFIFVIWVGFRRWRNPGSPSSADSDVFTLHLAVLELCGVVGSSVLTSSFYTLQLGASKAGTAVVVMAQTGQIAFHGLVCLEHYLAVVHPITYLQLKRNGRFMRNASSAVVWLLSCGMAALYSLDYEDFKVFPLLGLVILSLVTITFFCASVLFVLVRPGPGQRGMDRKHMDQLKRRAFHTIAAITVTLLSKFVVFFVGNILVVAQMQNLLKQCLVGIFALWVNLSCSLLLPTLFLYRRAKLHRQVKLNQK